MLYGSNAARMTGRLETARSLAAEGHAILSALEDPYLIAFACSALGAAEYALGYVESARSYLERARAGFASVGAGDDEALMIVNVGRCTFALGELVQSSRASRARARASRGLEQSLRSRARPGWAGARRLGSERGAERASPCRARRRDIAKQFRYRDRRYRTRSCKRAFFGVGRVRARTRRARGRRRGSFRVFNRASTDRARSVRARPLGTRAAIHARYERDSGIGRDDAIVARQRGALVSHLVAVQPRDPDVDAEVAEDN